MNTTAAAIRQSFAIARTVGAPAALVLTLNDDPTHPMAEVSIVLDPWDCEHLETACRECQSEWASDWTFRGMKVGA